MSEKQFISICKVEEVPVGEVRVFEPEDDIRVAICNIDGQLFAVDDLCTHDDGPLGEGDLDGFCIECPRHGALFDVRTGEVVRLPATVGIGTYATRVNNGEVQVEIELD